MFTESIRSSQSKDQSSMRQQSDRIDGQHPQMFCDFSEQNDFDGQKYAYPINRARTSNAQFMSHIDPPSSKMMEQSQSRNSHHTDMDQMHRLIEAFKRYRIEHNHQQKETKITLLQIARKLQMSYEMVRKRHVLYKKHGADYFYSKINPDSNHKTKLERKLVSFALTNGSNIKYCKDISAYIKQRYGILYSIGKINQIRKELKQMPTSNEQYFSSILCEELRYLLNDILSKSFDIFYVWRTSSNLACKFHSKLFLANRQKCIIRQINHQDVFPNVITQILFQLNECFEDNTSKNYCVIAYLEDIRGDAKDLLTQKINENNFLIQMAVFKAKVILLGQQKGETSILPQWIQDCYRRREDQQDQFLYFVEDEVDEIKEIICKGIKYFEDNLSQSKSD